MKKSVMRRKIMKNKVLLICSIVIVILAVAGVTIRSMSRSRSESKKQVIATESGGKQQKTSDKQQAETEGKKDPEQNSSKPEPTAENEADATEAPTQEASPEAVSTETPVPAASEAVTPPPAPITYSETEGNRKAYLTFDDGTSKQTDKILDVLKQYNVKATFFVTAQEGEENARRYRRIVEEGHSIGLHSVSHNYKQVYANLDAFITDVEGIRQFVLNTTGVDSHLYRFPGGSSNQVSTVSMDDCIRYLNQNGYRYFDWNVDTSDTVNRHQSVDELLSKVFGTVVDKYHNCVILMHDASLQDITVAALPQIIEGLQARGMEILPITENTPVVQHKKADSVQ